MGNFLHKHARHTKGPEITDTDRAILSLKTQRRKMEEQEKLLGQRIERHVEVARALIAENKKDRALLALKKKKLTENQMMQLHKLIINVEDMLNNIEATKTNTKIFGALKEGVDVLKQLQQQVTVEDVTQLMDDTAEAKAYQDELNALLGQSLSELDGEAVESELEAMEEQMQQLEALQLPTAPKVPPEAVAAAATAAAQTAAANASIASLAESEAAAADAESRDDAAEAEEARERQQLQPMLAQ